MLSKLIALASIFAVVGVKCVYAGEVDAANFLNTKLATKPTISYQRTVTRQRQLCEQFCPGPTIGRGGEMSPPCRQACRQEDYNETQNYLDEPRVTSTEVVEVRDLVFDTAKLTSLPEQAKLSTQEYQNCADVNLSISTSMSVSGSHSFTFSKSNGVTTTVGASINASFKMPFGGLSTTLSASRSLSTSSSTSESFNETVSRSLSATISASPHKQGKVELLAFETTVQIPFSATIVIDGTLAQNQSGLTKASQLLNEGDRTLPFSGTLSLTDVSEGVTRTVDIPGAPACKNPNLPLVTNTNSFTFPAKGLTAKQLSTYRKVRGQTQKPLNLVLKTLSAKTGAAEVVSSEGPGIGAPDGTIFTVLYTTETIRPEPICGFNDVGFPKNAKYSGGGARIHDLFIWQRSCDLAGAG
jgi:hypothetical protein